MNRRIDLANCLSRLALAIGLIAMTASAGQTDEKTGTRNGEVWLAKLDTSSRHIRFLVRLKKDDGKWSGNFISLDDDSRSYTLSDVSRTKDAFEFRVSGVSTATFSGKPDAANLKAIGTWKIGGAEMSLEFNKVTEEPKPNADVTWVGTLKTLFQEQHIQIRELESGDVYLDDLTRKVGGFVVTKEVNGAKLSFALPAIEARFEGMLSNDENTLSGQWKQGMLSSQLTLTKKSGLAKEDVEPIAPYRPQLPEAPFPYSCEDVRFDSGDVTLAGTLSTPKSVEGKFPAVILVSGSGPHDRDETILGHKPFLVIADHFTRHGIAVLRYDDRGIGKSTGDFAEATSEDFADDAEAALRFLRQHNQIDKASIGFCGHSEGGMIAPIVAARNPHVGFMILMAAPGIGGDAILAAQTRVLLQQHGKEEEEIERQVRMQRIFIDLCKASSERDAEKFKVLVSEAITDHLTEEERASGASELFAESAVRQFTNPWMRFYVRHDPATVLKQASCPVLAINGEKDWQVEPRSNLAAINAALEVAPTTDFQVIELPGLNHLFQKCDTGTINEYGEIEETFNLRALQLMTDWILLRER